MDEETFLARMHAHHFALEAAEQDAVSATSPDAVARLRESTIARLRLACLTLEAFHESLENDSTACEALELEQQFYEDKLDALLAEHYKAQLDARLRAAGDGATEPLPVLCMSEADAAWPQEILALVQAAEDAEAAAEVEEVQSAERDAAAAQARAAAAARTAARPAPAPAIAPGVADASVAAPTAPRTSLRPRAAFGEAGNGGAVEYNPARQLTGLLRSAGSVPAANGKRARGTGDYNSDDEQDRDVRAKRGRPNASRPPGREQAAYDGDDETRGGDDAGGAAGGAFLSAREQLRINDAKKGVARRPGLARPNAPPPPPTSSGPVQRSAHGAGRGAGMSNGKTSGNGGSGAGAGAGGAGGGNGEVDERLRNIDPGMVEMIENEILTRQPNVTWDDIAGLEFAKKSVMEIVILPLLRPDLFTGLRAVPKGILLFGPPGTGKTMIGQAIAAQSGATFFSISASALTSKWVGQGEKMVRALFAVARCHQPAVIFVDEIDSLLCQRSESDQESSRRIKTEFLIQLEGCGNSHEEQLLLVGATNRPQELDEAARRRLVKRLYIPLPNERGRLQLLNNLLAREHHSLTTSDLDELVLRTQGFSGADMKALCTEAALFPIRDLTNMQSIDTMRQICELQADAVRPVSRQDFDKALETVRPSVSPDEITQYLEWNAKFGSAALDPGSTR